MMKKPIIPMHYFDIADKIGEDAEWYGVKFAPIFYKPIFETKKMQTEINLEKCLDQKIQALNLKQYNFVSNIHADQ